jgi:hypothetical protein
VGEYKLNFFTHITLSKILYKQLDGIIELDKSAFLYGNIKPDMTRKCLRNPHTLQNYSLAVCNSADDLMNNKVSLQEYSIKLGEICHYVCDFYCQYHINEEIFNKFKDHFLYEMKLHFELMKNKSDIYLKNNLNTAKANIALTIVELRKEYSGIPATMKKDIDYAFIATICGYANLYLAFNPFYKDHTKRRNL